MTWVNPTLCGMCRALAPQTRAYLKVSLSVRWIWSQTSSIVAPDRTIKASLKSGSTPFLLKSQYDTQRHKVKPTALCILELGEDLASIYPQRLLHQGQARSSWRQYGVLGRVCPKNPNRHCRFYYRHISCAKISQMLHKGKRWSTIGYIFDDLSWWHQSIRPL
jgi:hypothetical protein